MTSVLKAPASNTRRISRGEILLSRRARVRRALVRLSVQTNKMGINGAAPVHPLQTLVAKAERLPQHHSFRLAITQIVRKYRKRRDHARRPFEAIGR